MIKNKIEILAPVSNYEMLKSAIYSGANAVYLGFTDFNARKNAENFKLEDINEIVKVCHQSNVKVNIVLNTLLYTKELERVAEIINIISSAGVDAIIVQDLGTALLCRKISPDLPLHASTQLACTSLHGALQLKDMGFSRVILARELSKQEILYITKHCGVETEVFVHGALCMGVSGQCYLSAFLGGRSGNRGECASPCRLPFCVTNKNSVENSDTPSFHLSLKDQSLIEYLNDFVDMGVACVKIEGRLRSPEYVACAVNACYSVLNNKYYDKSLLSDIFSRNGFTNAYYNNKIDIDMFGVRTKQENDLTKKAMPKIRELYRRPLQTIPVDMHFSFKDNIASLKVTEGNFNIIESTTCEAEISKSDNFKTAIERSLGKLGGTAFYLNNCSIEIEDNIYIPLKAINTLRQNAITNLLLKKGEIIPYKNNKFTFPTPLQKNSPATIIYARLPSIELLPLNLLDDFEKIIIPIDKKDEISDDIKHKVILELPRGIFGDDEFINNDIKSAISLGFTNFEINNISNLYELKTIPNINIYSGFSMNITNMLSLYHLASLGVNNITFSPETKLYELNNTFENINTGIIGYGHLPLMITRAQPSNNNPLISNLEKPMFLQDRKEKLFPMKTTGQIQNIYNPIPIYMGDRQREIFSNFTTLYFTNETMEEINDISLNYIMGNKFAKEFTRGLYY